MSAKDLTGIRIGSVTVLAYSHHEETKGGTDSIWNCVCDCGTFFQKRYNRLTDSHHATKSCGCYNRKRNREQGDRMVKEYGINAFIFKGIENEN